MSITTIRICETSDAKLMLQDGSFKDYLLSWSDRFPQQGRLKQIKDYQRITGGTLQEAFRLTTYATDEVHFEIGDKVVVKKSFGNLDLFLKCGSLWIGRGDALDNLSEKKMFPKTMPMKTLLTEKEIMKAPNVEKLVYRLLYRLWMVPDTFYRFGDHEIWTLDSRQDHVIISTAPMHKTWIERCPDWYRRHIDSYRKYNRKTFGEF